MKNIYIHNLVCIGFLLLLFIIPSKQILSQVVVIDAGHGYNYDGSNGDGRTELEINTNYAVSIQLSNLLEGSHSVVLTRPYNDVGSWISVDDRADICNFWNPMAFLSIHCNAGGGTGTETFYCDENDSDPTPDINFAEDVQSNMVFYGDWTDRRVVEDNSYLDYHLGVLSQTDATACYNEIGFVDYPADAAKLEDPDWQYEFAYAYAQAISDITTGIEDYITVSVFNPETCAYSKLNPV